MSADPSLPDIADEPGSSVSIYVPDAQDANSPQYTFLRLGKADIDHETILPPDPNVPATAGAGGGASPFDEGLVLYTTGSYSLNAPSVNTFASDNLSVVKDGNTLLSANLQTKSSPLFFGRAANVTFQNVDQLTVSQGDASNFLNGNSLTFWNGNDQSIGFGGLLWANMGFTSNIFGGEIINLTNDMATVQAPGICDYEVNEDKEISAVNSVKLNVNPAGASFVESAQTLTKIVNGVILLTTAVAGAYSLSELVQTDKASIDPDTLKKRMTQTNEDLEIMTTLVVAVQAASVLLGITLQIASKFASSTAASKLDLGVANALLAAGASSLLLTPNFAALRSTLPTGLVSISAGQGLLGSNLLLNNTEIRLVVGGAAYIELTDTTIKLVTGAGTTSMEIGPNGVTLNGLQVATNAPAVVVAPVPQPDPGAAALPLDMGLVDDAINAVNEVVQ